MEAAQCPTLWNRAPEEITQNLDHDDIEILMKRPYKIITTAPIRRSDEGGEVLGILAIDAPSSLHAKLRDDADVQHAIALGTLALQDDLVALYDLIHC